MVRARRLGIVVLPLVIAFGAQASSHKLVHHIRKHVPSGIGVMVDEARLISFARPAKTVFLGNPTIADIDILDARHAFVLGKTMGLTNLIALDVNGVQIENKPVMVTNTFAAATLFRGSDSFNYTCTSMRCETAPRPGDPKTYVDDTETAIAAHEAMGGKGATAVTAQGPAPAD
jgi:hypothetical protein